MLILSTYSKASQNERCVVPHNYFNIVLDFLKTPRFNNFRCCFAFGPERVRIFSFRHRHVTRRSFPSHSPISHATLASLHIHLNRLERSKTTCCRSLRQQQKALRQQQKAIQVAKPRHNRTSRHPLPLPNRRRKTQKRLLLAGPRRSNDCSFSMRCFSPFCVVPKTTRVTVAATWARGRGERPSTASMLWAAYCRLYRRMNGTFQVMCLTFDLLYLF